MNTQAIERAIYPRLLRRVRAVVIDEFVLLVGLAAWWMIIGISDDANPALKVGALLLVFFLLDPVLVALTGGTVGHHFMGMRVRVANRDKRASLAAATLRAVVRYALGWVSLIFILITRRHQAIHDYVSGTLVVLGKPEQYSAREKLVERAS